MLVQFNIVLDETNVLDIQGWKRPDLYEDRPPPLVIEVFVDTAHLAHNQSLVIVDDDGRRTEVSEALATSADSSPHPTKGGGKFCEVVLERWTVELGDPAGYTPAELNDPLPNVYKKGVVLFRSLYTFLRFLPAWKLHRRLARQAGNHQALRLKFRIKQGGGLARGQQDPLYTPLCSTERESDDVVEQYTFQPLVTPVGPLHCILDYRKNCGFGVADQESLLSSRFLGIDEGIPTLPAGGSLPGARSERPREHYSSTAVPAATTRERPRGLLGAYGSLGTFHGPDKRGSPVSELKQRAIEGDYEDDDDYMHRVDALQDEDGVPRRTSGNYVENPPFKVGSLASSPRPSPSPGTSVGRTESVLTKYGGGGASSKRTSLNALPQQQLRAPYIPNETAVASSGSSSPKPAPVRYSSSFANRTKRFTSQSGRAGESNTSSGRGSSDSKERSDQLNEGTGADSSGTKTDEDDIASFISDLEKSKDIKFHTPPSARDNVVNLAKYAQMRDPSTQLAEEMSSSSLIHTSSTPPSRRLSNVPGLSTSSSPSRALAHAPHVRSRLSTHSIVEEATGASGISGASGEGSDSPKIHEEEEEEDDEPFIFPHDNNLE